MLKRYMALVMILAYIFSTGGIRSLQAQYLSTRPPEGQPDVFSYGWRGLFLGMLGGAAVGYLRYANDSSNVTENILRSVGYGALAGAVLGVGLGFYDVGQGRRGTGDIVLHDMYLGGGFGTGVGAIVGGINALATSDWTYLGKGAAWGALAGGLLGVAVGLYEAPRLMGEIPPSTTTRLTTSPAFFADSRGNLCPGLSMRKAF